MKLPIALILSKEKYLDFYKAHSVTVTDKHASKGLKASLKLALSYTQVAQFIISKTINNKFILIKRKININLRKTKDVFF